ncbi:MAG: hypothetical protein GF313_01005 [Caldithrix sp.]|nr:hypothetical protein [Caldithrix sp.]
MKILISAEKVRQAHQDGKKEIPVQRANTIITDEARSLAQKLGLRFTESSQPWQPPQSNGVVKSASMANVDEAVVKKIVEQVVQKLPPEKYDPEIIKQTVLQVLNRHNK